MDCRECKYDASLSNETKAVRKLVQVHTLHHGTITICAIDYACGYCGNLIPYDGLRHGLFRINKKNLCTQELLDMWVWDVCGSGGTFRDAYYSWASKSTAFSASHHPIGNTTIEIGSFATMHLRHFSSC